MCSPRTFDTNLLKAGFPNLLVTSQGSVVWSCVTIQHSCMFLLLDNILRSVLALYARDTNLPLPTHEEVLLCTHETTAEEVYVLMLLSWRVEYTYVSIGEPTVEEVYQ